MAFPFYFSFVGVENPVPAMDLKMIFWALLVVVYTCVSPSLYFLLRGRRRVSGRKCWPSCWFYLLIALFCCWSLVVCHIIPCEAALQVARVTFFNHHGPGCLAWPLSARAEGVSNTHGSQSQGGIRASKSLPQYEKQRRSHSESWSHETTEGCQWCWASPPFGIQHSVAGASCYAWHSETVGSACELLEKQSSELPLELSRRVPVNLLGISSLKLMSCACYVSVPPDYAQKV